jgi:hypothetical protein
MCHNCRTELTTAERDRELAAGLFRQLRGAGEQPPAASSAPQRTFGAVVGLEPVVPQIPAPPAIAVCPAATVEPSLPTIAFIAMSASMTTVSVVTSVASGSKMPRKRKIAMATIIANLASMRVYQVWRCDSVVDKDDCRSDDNGNVYCESCWNDKFSYCEECDSECEANDMVTMHWYGRSVKLSWCESAPNNFTRVPTVAATTATVDGVRQNADGDDICRSIVTKMAAISFVRVATKSSVIAI